MTALPARKIDLVPGLSVHARVNRFDPTRTMTLRSAFVREMTRRFKALKKVIVEAIVDKDCFGLEQVDRQLLVQFNPCHDEQGRFCSTGAGGNGIAHDLANEMRYATASDGKERALIIDPTGNRTDMVIGDESSVGSVYHPNKDIAGSGLHVVHTHPINDPLSIKDIESLANQAGIDKISAILPNGEIHSATVVGNRAELYRRANELFLEGKTRVLDAHIEGKITTKEQYDRELRKEQNLVLKKLNDDGLIKYQIFAPSLVANSNPTTMANPTAPAIKQFDFPTSQAKKDAFMTWLKVQEDAGILETETRPQIGQAIDEAWTGRFIKDSYSRGVQRARDELRGRGYAVPPMEATGGIFGSLSQPPHIERLGIAYGRAFDQLKGITSAMDSQISHILAQGLADGDGPRTLARKLLATIDGSGAGTLGITDSLGRFIPAERRAMMLARTEIIRSHHLGNIQEMRNWGVVGVEVMAEWVTAGYKVCPQCQKLAKDGPYTLDEIEKMIPAHPHCRCCAVPKDMTGKKAPAQPLQESGPEYVGGPVPPGASLGGSDIGYVPKELPLETGEPVWSKVFGTKREADAFVAGTVEDRVVYAVADDSLVKHRLKSGNLPLVKALELDVVEGTPGWSSGHYLSFAKPEAKVGSSVLSAKVKLSNPYEYTWDGKTGSKALTSTRGPLGEKLSAVLAENSGMSRHEAVTKVLKEMGHDGIIMKIPNGGVILFDKEQIAVYKIEKFKQKIIPTPAPVAPIAPAQAVQLTQAQKDAIAHTVKIGKVTDERLKDIAGTENLDYARQLHVKLGADLEAGMAELCIRRKFYAESASFKDCYENGVMKSQFLTGTSSGSNSAYKGGGRDRWEETVFGRAYQKDKDYVKLSKNSKLPVHLAQERPIYGYLTPGAARDGSWQYGEVVLVLKDEVRHRTTFTIGNSSGARGHWKDTGHLGRDSVALLKTILENNSSDHIKQYLAGTKPLNSLNLVHRSESYTELQFHGGIDFRRDIKKIVVEGSSSKYKHLKDLATRYNIDIEFTTR